MFKTINEKIFKVNNFSIQSINPPPHSKQKSDILLTDPLYFTVN